MKAPAACLLLLVAVGTARAEPCHMAVVSRIHLEPDGPMWMATATLNGGPARLLFDTGSYSSVLTTPAVDRLKLVLLKSEQFNSARGVEGGIGGERSAIAVKAKTVDIGGLKARDYNFMQADVVRPPIDGLLSTDLISQFDIDLDLPEHQAVLYRPLGDCSAPAAFLAGPLYTIPLRPIGADRRPRVRVQVGTQSVVALIDTGAAHSVLFRGAAARLGLRVQDLASDKPRTVQGIGPALVNARRHAVEDVTMGDLTLSNMSVDVLDAPAGDEVEMLLGDDFLRAVHVWISYSSHTLIMQYPPQASKRMP